MTNLTEANKDWELFNNYLSNSNLDFSKYIKIFKNNKQRLNPEERDIYYWMKKSPEEFIVRMIDLQNVLSSSKEKQVAKNQGSEKIWENDNFIILKILTYGASKYYGKGTKWCISGNNSEENDGNYYFNQYLKNEYSAFYFVLSKTSNEKWCICTKLNNKKKIKQIWDAANESIEIIPNLPDIIEIGYNKNWNNEFEFDDEW